MIRLFSCPVAGKTAMKDNVTDRIVSATTMFLSWCLLIFHLSLWDRLILLSMYIWVSRGDKWLRYNFLEVTFVVSHHIVDFDTSI